MARTLYSFQEEGHQIDSGAIGVVTIHPEVRIAVEQALDCVKIRLFINVGNVTIGIAENEYESVERLMEELGIDDIDEVWEILEH